MRKMAYIILFFLLFTGSARAEKKIWFWLEHQVGAAYKDGILVHKFDALTGSDEPVMNPRTGRWSKKPTPKGSFRILRKHAFYTNRFGIEMPYSLFFTGVHAIHGWAWDEDLPSSEQRRYYASSGCISLNRADIEWLFDWAPVGTKVYIVGERLDD